MSKRYFAIVILALIAPIWFVCSCQTTLAIADDILDKLAEDGIIFYEPEKKLETPTEPKSCDPADDQEITVSTDKLPESTIKKLENAKVKEKAKNNITRYKYAEEKTGLPWQVVAALHFREGSMSSDASILNGQKLTKDGSCYTNVDGLQICSNANEDAKKAAEHFISMAKSVYGIDVVKNKSLENFAYGFLAYNRGYMYKCKNVPYTKSPYVMNYYDQDHMDMKWIDADSYSCKGKKLNGVSGKKNLQLGALTVLVYLYGNNTETSSSTPSSSSNSCVPGKFIFYSQYDERWRSYPLGNSTIGENGSGPTSFAMMASMLLDKEILPPSAVEAIEKSSAAKILQQIGLLDSFEASWGFTKALAESYGLEYKKLTFSSTSNAITEINEYLKNGWMMHVWGKGSKPFTNKSHYIGIRGISNNGKWLIADSSHSESDSTRLWNPEDIIKAGMNLGNVFAIRSKSGSNCETICEENKDGGDEKEAEEPKNDEPKTDEPKNDNPTTTTLKGFSSASEAQFIIDAYKKDKLNGYNFLVPKTGDRHHNCVAFSIWFINYYTKVSYKGGPYGNGNQVVDNFYNKKKKEYPSLKISNEPTIYSLASWGAKTPNTSKGNHTGIVIGIDKKNNKILIAEAGWNNPNFTGIHSYKLSQFTGNSKFKYIDLNGILKPNMGLK